MPPRFATEGLGFRIAANPLPAPIIHRPGHPTGGAEALHPRQSTTRLAVAL